MAGEDVLRERILVIDDEENLLHFLSKLLQGEGYQVETAGTGGRPWRRPKSLTSIWPSLISGSPI